MEASHRRFRVDRPRRPPTDRPRVALVHDWLTGLRGGEKCLEILCRVFPEATIHTLIHRKGSAGRTIERMPIRTSPLQVLPAVHQYYRHLLPLMPCAARWWKVGDVDLVVSLSHCVAKAVRVPAGIPHVCYCFTPMRYAWEGRNAYLDSSGPRWKRKLLGGVLDRLREWDRESASGVTQFIAISKTVQRRIQQCYNRESLVIHPPVDTEFYTPDHRPREPFYLCVSALVPYKRIDHAVQACSASGRSLVVIGQGPDRVRLERMAGQNVRFLGWQPDEVIRDHMRRCRALIFPGEEDFGIVPVEALACGTPVIALGRGGVSETVDDTMGFLYREPTVAGLVRALSAWEQAGSPCDAIRARHQAERFASQVFEDQMRRCLLQAIAGSCQVTKRAPNALTRSRDPYDSLRGAASSWNANHQAQTA